MIKIGLTGGIGSGKSEAAHALARLGAHVVIADDLAVDLVAPGSPVLDALVEEFGDGVLLPDGRLNRAGLAEVAFASGEAIKRLNSATHPPLVNAIRKTIERVERAGDVDVIVVDAALLAEWGILDLFDIVLVIDASLETRFNRLAGVGLSRDAALARMRAQLPRDRLLDAADVVIENDGTIEELGERIRTFWTERVSGGRNDA